MVNHTLNDTDTASVSVFLQSDKASTRLASSNVIFYLNETIGARPDQSMLIGLISCEVPYSFYNIDTPKNKISFRRQTASGVFIADYDLTLDRQNYDVDSIVSKFNSLFTTNNMNMNMSFNDNTNKFTFNSTTTDQFIITSTTLNKSLGLPTTSIPTSANTTFTCPNVCQLTGTSSIYINCVNLSISNLDSRGDLNGTICKLPIECDPTSFIYYKATENNYYLTNNQTITHFHITITDDDNQELDLNGGDFSLGLNIHFVQKREQPIFKRYLLGNEASVMREDKKDTIDNLNMEKKKSKPKKPKKK